MNAAPEIRRMLTFNDDGTIDPAQLEGLPQEFIDRVSTSEGQAFIREQIAKQKKIAEFRAMAANIRAKAHDEHEARRPSGVSGRQRKRLRRLLRTASKSGFGRLHLETSPSARGA